MSIRKAQSVRSSAALTNHEIRQRLRGSREPRQPLQPASERGHKIDLGRAVIEVVDGVVVPGVFHLPDRLEVKVSIRVGSRTILECSEWSPVSSRGRRAGAGWIVAARLLEIHQRGPAGLQHLLAQDLRALDPLMWPDGLVEAAARVAARIAAEARAAHELRDVLELDREQRRITISARHARRSGHFLDRS